MKCEKCKIGDLHFQQEIIRWEGYKFRNWHKFWHLEEIGYIFVCDNCGSKKEIKTKDDK